MNQQRIEYIDIAKGVGIVFVVLGHVVWGSDDPRLISICYFIYSFHMPLFFILSGLCIKDSKTLDLMTIKKKVKAYLIPFFIWSIAYCFLFHIIDIPGGNVFEIDFNNVFFAHVVSICGLAPIWFLLALFIAEIIVLAIKPALARKGGWLLALCVLAGISICTSIWYTSLDNISLIGQNYLIGLLRIAPTTFFVLFGFAIKDYIKGFEQYSCYKRMGIVFLLICLQLLMCNKAHELIDIHVFVLGNPWLYYPKSIIGAVAILLLSQSIHSKILLFIGKKTKEVMILHFPPYWTLLLTTLLSQICPIYNVGLYIITITIITIAMCLVIDTLMSRFTLWRFAFGK